MPNNDKNTNKNIDKKINKNSDRKNRPESLPFGCSSRITVSVIFCVLCAVIVFVVAKWDSLSPKGVSSWFNFSHTSSENFPVEFLGTNLLDKNLQLADNGLVYISDTSLVKLDAGGETVFSEQHSFTNPALKTCGENIIAYNIGGSNFRIMAGEEEKFHGTQGTAISDCDIAADGTFAVLSDQTGYLSQLSVFDADNNLIYSYSFNDCYAVSVSISSDSAMAVVGAVNTYNGEMFSRIYVLDFKKTEPLMTFNYENQILYEVDFLSDNSFAVITDSLLSVIDTDDFREHPHSFENKVLTSYCIKYDNGVYLSLARSDDGRDCTVLGVAPSGEESANFASGLRITSVDVFEDRIACLADNKLCLFNEYGDSLGDWDVDTDARSILLAGKKLSYILGVSEIRRLDLK